MKRTLSVAAFIAAVFLQVCLCLVLLPPGARAHDHWVSAGRYKNVAGEWCCGHYDCKDGLAFRATAIGWLIETGELVSYDEGVLDRNGKAVNPPHQGLTICRRPDGTRRCVFGPKPGF